MKIQKLNKFSELTIEETRNYAIVEEQKNQGFGLKSMSNRADSMGGRLEVINDEDTTLLVYFPMEESLA